MKTPEEIKNGLECCIPRNYESTCRKCPYSRDDSSAKCIADLENDALGYIQQLESRLAQVERERDAAVRDICILSDACTVCTHGHSLKNDCKELFGYDRCGFEWRGVCEKNTVENNV